MVSKTSIFLATGQTISGIINNDVVQGLIISLIIALLDFAIKKIKNKK